MIMLEIVASLILGLAPVLCFIIRYARQGVYFTGDMYRRLGRNGKKKFPLGWNNPPADSVHGDLKNALSTGSLHEYLVKKHQGGQCPVVAFWWMDQHVVSVSSISGFKTTENLHCRPSEVFDTFFTPLHGTQSIQSVNAEEWKKRRSLLQGAIRGDVLLSFYDRFLKIASDTVDKWSNACRPCGTGHINLKKEMFWLSMRGVLNTSFTPNENDDYVNNLASLYDQCKSEMDLRILDVPLPGSRRELDFQSRLKSLQGELRKMKADYVYSAKEHYTGPILPLLNTLLNSQLPEDVIDSDMMTFLGGFHTASYFATWTFLYLAQHPNMQDILLEEKEKLLEGVDDQEERNSKLKSYSLSGSTYLRQFLDEALRMSMTAPFSGHYCDEDMDVNGYHIPAGTPIMQAIGVAMKNESVWEKPHTFDPDRFNPGTLHGKRGPEFRPFGVSNTRRCPANHFVYLMMSVYITTLIERFTFHLTEASSESKEAKYGIATSPKEDFSIGVTLR